MNEKKVVLVTGSSRGLGRNIVKQFASTGYTVVINYNNSMEDAVSLGQEIEKYNCDYLIVKCDITKDNEVKNMIDTIIKKYNRIDVLVNNAGIAYDTIFEDKNIDLFKKILDVNLIGTFLVSKLVGEYMLKEKNGNIINISSTNGIDTYYPESIDYDASKAGVISLTHNLALHYSPYIRVNCVCPGWINTDMNKEMDNEYKELEEDKILLGRFAEPEEIANVVMFLASDKSSYVNNSIIRVDGGKR